MCGIVGYIGNRPILDTLINGLSRLEYRGYDSAGVAVLKDNSIDVLKEKGKVAVLKNSIEKNFTEQDRSSIKLGIAHTRWATHGLPTEINAHPHIDDSGILLLFITELLRIILN